MASLVFLLLPGFAAPLEWISWSSGPRVALTFDDGPHPIPTRELCDVLGRYHVPATFFVVGRVAAENPDTITMLDRAGHEVANHTWSHPDVRFLTRHQLRRELDRTRALIQTLTGRRTFLFRTPGGTEAYLRGRFQVPSGYELVLWNVHSLDQEGTRASRIAARVLAQVKDGDVVLMHNGLASTRTALGVIIPELQSRGFQFVTVSEMLALRGRSKLARGRSAFVQG